MNETKTVEKITNKEKQTPQNPTKLLKKEEHFIKLYYKLIAGLTEKELEKETYEEEVILACLKKADFNRAGKKPKIELLGMGRDILRRHDATLSPKEQFARIGLSVRQIALHLRKLALTAKSETARIQALNIATKCLGLQREGIDTESGAEINIVSGIGKKGSKSAQINQTRAKMRICLAGGDDIEV